MHEREYSLRSIAKTLGRSVSALSDEIHLGKVHGVYDPKKAHAKARVRRKQSKYQGMKIVRHDALKKEVDSRLLDDQSPAAIAGHVSKYQKHLPSISKNAIYRYLRSVYGRKIEVHQYLRKQRRGRRRGKTKSLSHRTFIDKRPKHIDHRRHIGDAEADFIVSGKSGKGILLVVVDRKGRTAFLERILPVTIRNMHAVFLSVKKRFPELATITTDNDVLFAQHKELELLLNVKIYFCHAYHSWEKGTVENTNKVIRRDIPKGSDISRYSKHFIGRLEAKLNRRPMKCLDDHTPQEILDAYRRRKRNKKRLL